MVETPKEMLDLQEKLTQYEREIRKLNREISHLKNAIVQEKTAYTTVLNQQKASTFIQRERERYLALLLANSPSIILFLSQTERVEFCTEYFLKKAKFENTNYVLGHTAAEVLSPFLDAGTLKKLKTESENAIRSNSPVSFDISFNFGSASASAEEFVGLLVPMSDENQKNNGLMLMFHDVTDLKRSREQALEASKAKSVFLSSMSHEIRTPMNAIIGMTAIGKRELGPERKDYAFEKIENASTHLLGVINDILDISKIESGKMELSPVSFNFAQMFDRVKSVVSVKMQDKHQNLSVYIDPAIPEVLFGDDQRIAQVITNLLSNATKFTPENGNIEFNAALESESSGKCVISMFVKDDGIGISKEQQSKLFSIFQQAEAGTSRKYGGSGLGLVISKRIIEMMKGDITIESEPGKGSCFYFKVTVSLPDSSREPGMLENNAQTPEERDFSNNTILIVDDVDINLEIAAAFLEPSNITIDTAKSGREAFNMFAASPQRYDLILMDMQMPEIDGIEATKMIRSLSIPEAATIPIIAMTANVFKEDIEKCLSAGMNDHLGKPINIDQVMKILSCYIK